MIIQCLIAALTVLYVIHCITLSCNAIVKIPLPPQNAHINLSACTTSEKSTTLEETSSITNQTNKTQSSSPCLINKNLLDYEPSYGDPCDPLLFKFARRKYDDNIKADKDWARKILGRRVDRTNSDLKYTGSCYYMCPEVLCIGVETRGQGTKKRQYVDIFKFDCIETDEVYAFKGVCTCGHLYSRVDPLITYVTYNDTLQQRLYSATYALNRSLAWDATNKRCAAQHYGHCSLEWPSTIPQDKKTECLDRHLKCVNRSASFKGIPFRPVRSNYMESGAYPYWYGICDYEVTIKDPFAGAKQISLSYLTVLACLLLYVSFT